MVTTRNLFSGYFPTFDFLLGHKWSPRKHIVTGFEMVNVYPPDKVLSSCCSYFWCSNFFLCVWDWVGTEISFLFVIFVWPKLFFCMNVTTNLFFVWFFHVQSGFCEWVPPNTADSWWVQCVFWTFLLTTQCLKCYTAYFYIFSSIMSNCAETCAGGESALWDSFLEWQ